MQILMLSGSRNREGRTAQIIEAIGRGVVKAGGKWESVFLTEHNIEKCRQCEKDGWGICRREQRCVIKDDFDEIAAKVKAADAVVFANPVYFGDLSESMRAFLDRLRRTGPRIPAGPPRAGGTPAIGVCLAGGGGGNAPTCCVSLEKVMLSCGFDVVDMIPVRRQNLEFKKKLLELTGEWLVTKPNSGEHVPPR
jgi:multimeric flavodoxin WrbA